MSSLLSKSVARFLPSKFIPIGTKSTSEGHIEQSIQEGRASFERKVFHYENKFLNRISPIRRAKDFWRKRRLLRKQTTFFTLIGKITLAHAGIEEDLKATLVGDWDVPTNFTENIEDNGVVRHDTNGNPEIRTVNIEELFSKWLKKRFFREIKKRNIPAEFEDRYRILFENFKSISQDRNSTIKANYSFNDNTADVSRINEIQFHTANREELSFDEIVVLWMPRVDFDKLRTLHGKLVALSGNFLRLRVEIERDKQALFLKLCNELGKSYPVSARNNPYLYQSILEAEMQLKQ